MRVHDLSNEKRNCGIAHINEPEQHVEFEPDTREQAEREGYRPCHHCMGAWNTAAGLDPASW
jgi:hypothetical protein